MSYTVPASFRTADTLIAVWSGALKIGSESEPHKPFHTLVLSAAPGENGVQLTATEENTEFVLVCIRVDTRHEAELTFMLGM